MNHGVIGRDVELARAARFLQGLPEGPTALSLVLVSFLRSPHSASHASLVRIAATLRLGNPFGIGCFPTFVDGSLRPRWNRRAQPRA
jgi:hypothetical protein